MNDQIVQALLTKVMGWTKAEDSLHRPFFQTMSKYKYDDYKQYSTGMRFIERFAFWLNQFKTNAEKNNALKFIKENLIYISQNEMAHLVSSVYPDLIDQILIDKVSNKLSIPNYEITKIINTKEYKALRRSSLFLGLSDGARTEIFRRSNTGSLTHEQIYLTYELSPTRATKMKKELKKSLKDILGHTVKDDDVYFKNLFLLDDFSASGKSYINYDKSAKEFKGKISSLYKDLREKPELQEILKLKNLNVYIVLYICSEQAYKYLNVEKIKMSAPYNPPEICPVYILREEIKLNEKHDTQIIELCNNNDYYDKDCLEDKHTVVGGGENVKLGFGQCALPIVLDHNTPNNSISILWAYEEAKFKGLFPRIPRHKE